MDASAPLVAEGVVSYRPRVGVGAANDGRQARGSVAGTLGIALLVCVLAAVGGYLLGRSSGADIDAARLAGAEEGRGLARRAAEQRGYQEGRRVGERAGHRATYRNAYKAAYRSKAQALLSQVGRGAAQQPGSTTVPKASSGGKPRGSKYTDQLPNGKPGYVLPEGQRSP